MGRNGKEPGAKWKAICILLLAVVVMAGLYRGGRWLEERSRKPEPRGNYQDRKASDTTVTYNGTGLPAAKWPDFDFADGR